MRNVKESAMKCIIAGMVGLALTPGWASAQGFGFINVADNKVQGFAGFGTMPAINNGGDVAFLANGAVQGVFKWHAGMITTLASTDGSILSSFGDDVVINSAGVVAYDADLNNTGDRDIFTTDGVSVKTIVDSDAQGLVGGAFLGISAMNASGTVLFVAFRNGFGSQAMFAGNGGPLTTLVDTANSDFSALGNAAINASGEVAFNAFRNDGSEAIFAGPGGATVIADTNNSGFSEFLDPVMNNFGVVGTAGFFSGGGAEVFTGRGQGIRPRTNPAGSRFIFIDNVSINNASAVAFFGEETSGGQGIFFAPPANRHAPKPVIQSGDALFGSTVTSLSLGRFSLNDANELVFVYGLQDGRSGIAIAIPRQNET